MRPSWAVIVFDPKASIAYRMYVVLNLCLLLTCLSIESDVSAHSPLVVANVSQCGK